MINPTIVCVLGAHRSGTSLVTRVLNLLGMHLGPRKHLMPPADWNPTGYWEHRQIEELNNTILERLGGKWYEPPIFPQRWENSSELDDLRQRAHAIIQEDFATAKVWGWKNPQTCLTLPFWQQLLPTMRYVICLRHPIDVARSLEYRKGCSLEKGIYLWLLYIESALEYTTGHPRRLIFYEYLLANWQHDLQHLAEFLGNPELAKQTDIENAIREFINPRLQHYCSFKTGRDYEANHLSKAIDMAHWVYLNLKDVQDSQQDLILQLIKEALQALTPEIERQKREAHNKWMKQVSMALKEIGNFIPDGESFILVDDGQWQTSESIAGRRRIPFIERDGQYWGVPPDDATAISELDRLRRSGASFIVFGWPAFWWFDYYTEFHKYLRSKFTCILENSRLITFDLQR